MLHQLLVGFMGTSRHSAEVVRGERQVHGEEAAHGARRTGPVAALAWRVAANPRPLLPPRRVLANPPTLATP